MGMSSPPSRFLSEMPPDLLEMSEERSLYSYEAQNTYRRRRRDEDFGYSYDDEEEGEEEEERKYDEVEPRERPGYSSRPVQPQPRSLAEVREFLKMQEQKPAGPVPNAGAPGKILKSGVRVRHHQFGDGVVVSRERIGQDIKLIVDFSRVGRKTLIEKYAKLQAL